MSREGEARVLSINVSAEKGVVKRPVDKAEFITDWGIKGDAHAGSSAREVSLLDRSEIARFERRKGIELEAGAFAENITTLGLDLCSLEIGTGLLIGDVKVRISQIGKDCHAGCGIRKQIGDCIMPTKGVFAEVIEGGKVEKGDLIRVL